MIPFKVEYYFYEKRTLYTYQRHDYHVLELALNKYDNWRKSCRILISKEGEKAIITLKYYSTEKKKYLVVEENTIIFEK